MSESSASEELSSEPELEEYEEYATEQLGTDGQWATTVVNFSSQYGTHGTGSYTAANIAGPPGIYPKYGDFVEAFVLVGAAACYL